SECARRLEIGQPFDFDQAIRNQTRLTETRPQRIPEIKDDRSSPTGRNMMIVVIAATKGISENRIMNARTINKIDFVYRIARFGFLLALGLLALRAIFATAAPIKTDGQSKPDAVATETTSLKPPNKGQIPVAFLISDGAVVIDFCGPWEVFQDAMIPSSEEM